MYTNESTFLIRHRAFLAFLFLVGVLSPSVSFAGNGPVPPPTIREGQFVYTPDNCTPKGMSQAQQATLNGRLANLHNPFYVVILCDLPRMSGAMNTYARDNGFRGDTETKRIETTTSMLMEDWAAEQPNAYDPANSGVFVIAFEPRKYAWHPALHAKNALGLDQRGQDEFTQKFVRAAKQRPADYGAGIGNLATGYDDWYYDRTDPVRISQRAEAERQRQEQRQLQAAQGALDAEILHLSGLLEETKYLPGDVDTYRETLAQAKKIRKANDPTKMLAEASQMEGTVAVLDEYVSERQTEARNALLLLMLQWLAIGATLFVIGYFIRRRRQQQSVLIDQWTTIIADWDLKVRNAHDRWAEHYLERDDIIGLNNIAGATKELFDATTQKVDDLLVRIRGMQAHQADCERLYKKGGFFSFTGYEAAIRAFEMPFEFDTGKMNETDLFGGETETLTVTPANFATETNALFAASIDGWNRLQRAAEERYGETSEDFPHTNMDILFQLTAENQIPERWIADHPLYGDDDSDASFYANLDTLCASDPLAYVERLTKIREDEKELLDQVKRLVKLQAQISKVRVTTAFDSGGTNVRSEDDSELTLTAARQAEDKFAGLLASADEEAVKAQANRVVELYRKTTQQRAEILSAVKGAEGAIESAKAQGQEAQRSKELANNTLTQATKVHKQLQPVGDAIKAADRFLREGAALVTDAENALQQSRHLDSRRLADQAKTSFQTSISRSSGAQEHCALLDAQKTDFERKLKSAPHDRSRLATKMRGYGTHATSLASLSTPAVNGVADYAALALVLDNQVNDWRRSVRAAESSYEDEQRRIRRQRQEAAAKKRREEEEERRARRRRQDSYSSSSSSYGGGGYGGSSGSFGGGGFGGSSGSF